VSLSKPLANSNAASLIKVSMALWVIGLLLAGENCHTLNSFVAAISEYIPGIHSYSVATKHTCMAKAIWAFSWASAPVAAIISIMLAGPAIAERLKNRHVILIFCLFLVFLWACFIGVYDPYPGTDTGRWANMYRETKAGVLAVTFILWFGLLTSFYVLVAWVKNKF